MRTWEKNLIRNSQGSYILLIEKYLIRKFGMEYEEKPKVKIREFKHGIFIEFLPTQLKGQALLKYLEQKKQEIAEIIWLMDQSDALKVRAIELAKRQE